MSRSRTRLLAAPASAALLVLLAACSGGSTAATTTEDPAADASAAPAGQDGGGRAPGVTGEIAAVSDLLAQVQGDDGQTAVTWDDSTAITQTVAGTLADVTTGVCVTAAAGEDGAAATSVAVSPATDGECAGGFGGGPGGGAGGERPEGVPDGAPTDMPEGEMPEMPDGAPTDLPEGGGFGSFTAGLVTAVDGSTITVESADGTTATLTVDDATTYTVTVSADATAVTVGRCVTAQGEADSSGQVAATSLVLSDATDAGCSTGFGGGGFGGGPRGGTTEGEDADA